MKIRIIGSVFLLSFLALGGCTAITEAGYYWGDYSGTLYKYTKAPSEETLAAHVEQLNHIVEVSNEKGLRVPPGIYAELGYIDAKKGQDKQAKAYYEAEMQNYPESRLFLEKLIVMDKDGS